MVSWLKGLSLFLFAMALGAAPETLDLSGPWRMKDLPLGQGVLQGAQSPSPAALPGLEVTVPTTERAALTKAGVIPDPYVGVNNEASQWTEEREWWFYRTFTVDPASQGKVIDLVFHGIVYQGEAWLNGERLGALEGMFNPSTFRVTGLLRYGPANVLAVRLQAPEDARIRNYVRGLQFDLPKDRPQDHVICQSLYGWDWAPHMVVTGIWRPVELRLTDGLRIDRPWVRTRLLAGGRAHVSIRVEAENLGTGPVQARLRGVLRPLTFRGPDLRVERTLALPAGAAATAAFELDLDQPRLWWPNGMGDPDLYSFEVEAEAGGRVSDRASAPFGIRDFRLVPNEHPEELLKAVQAAIDADLGPEEDPMAVFHMGRTAQLLPWTFEVNGRRLFVKGSNWVPADQMLRLDRGRYDHLLTLARDAHFNTLRVWGGGLFETDDFYDLCDRKGLLTIFEFLSSGNAAGLDRERFGEAARAALRRVRNHPSLAYYCGGNEFNPDAKGFKDLIDGTEALIQAEDPDRTFRRASPYGGDEHAWDVWHSLGAYTRYRTLVPFRSEAGLSALPVLENVLKFTPPDRLWPVGKDWLEYRGTRRVSFNHKRHQDRYTSEFGPAPDLGTYIRQSQLAQGLADGFDIEACRSRMFRNSGVLIWQLDDAWPCASWSLVDWYGTPKPGYFFAKRACRPVHLAADFETYLWDAGQAFRADLSLLNDLDRPCPGLQVESRLLDLQGRVLDQRTGTGSAPAHAAQPVLTHTWAIPEALAGKTFFLAVRLTGPGGEPVSELFYPMAVRAPGKVKPQGTEGYSVRIGQYEGIFSDLQALPKAAPSLTGVVEPAGPGGHRVTLTLVNPGPAVLFDARLKFEGEGTDLEASYEDNDFFLLPGERRTVAVGITPSPGRTGPLRVTLDAWNAAVSVELR